MIKNRYSDNYKRLLKLNKRGRVAVDAEYVGDYYQLPFDEAKKKKTAWVNLGCSVLLLAVQLVTGMVNQDSSRTFWIVYPYMFVFLPCIYFLMGAVTYFEVPLKMQKAKYETSLVRIKRSCIGAMVLVALSAILDLIYIVIYHGSIQIEKELIYLFFHMLFLVISYLYGRYYDKVYQGIVIEENREE